MESLLLHWSEDFLELVFGQATLNGTRNLHINSYYGLYYFVLLVLDLVVNKGILTMGCVLSVTQSIKPYNTETVQRIMSVPIVSLEHGINILRLRS